MTAADCEADRHLENIIKNIGDFLVSANTSVLSANGWKFTKYPIYMEKNIFSM